MENLNLTNLQQIFSSLLSLFKKISYLPMKICLGRHFQFPYVFLSIILSNQSIPDFCKFPLEFSHLHKTKSNLNNLIKLKILA